MYICNAFSLNMISQVLRGDSGGGDLSGVNEAWLSRIAMASDMTMEEILIALSEGYDVSGYADADPCAESARDAVEIDV